MNRDKVSSIMDKIILNTLPDPAELISVRVINREVILGCAIEVYIRDTRKGSWGKCWLHDNMNNSAIVSTAMRISGTILVRKEDVKWE